MRFNFKRIYYGWFVLGGVSGINFANGATSIGVLTVFIIPLTTDFGWTRTQIAAATSIGAILGAVAAPFTGRLTDRFGARVPLTIGALLIIAATVNLALMQTLLWFYIAFGIARLADQGLVQAPSSPAIAKWFVRYRGRAMSVLFLITSAGGVVLPLMVQAVIELRTWREAWLVLGSIMLVVGLLPVFLLVRRQPEDMGLRVDGDVASPPGDASRDESALGQAGEAEVSWKFSEAIRTQSLWVLTASLFLIGVISTGTSLHLVPYLIDAGIDSTAAVGAVSITFFSAAVSVLFWGYLADKYSARWLLGFNALLRTGGIALLLVTDSLGEAYAVAVLQGVSEAGLRTFTVIALANLFGRQNLGSIYGVNRAFQVAGMALGPLISGAVFDSTSSYTGAFVTFLFLGLIATVLALAARTTERREPRP